MQKIINSVAQSFQESEAGRDALRHYIEMMQAPGWQTHQAFLIEMGNRLSNEVLNKRFQALDKDEKLIRLAAYSMTSEVIKFLLNPAATLRKLAKLKNHNTKMNKGATKGKRPKGD